MRTKVLFTASLLPLIATAYVVTTYGQSVYFVAFHKPLHVTLAANTTKPFAAPSLPLFQVRSSVASTQLRPGDTQTITVTATSDYTLPAYVEVWVESPLHTQVFRSPTASNPTTFAKGQQQTLVYRYTLPYNLPQGTYSVSAILTSVNNQTDYYVHTNFATFTVT